MPDPYTPVDMAAIDLILAEYLRADVAARVSIRIAEALDSGAREARRKAARGVDVAFAPRLGWWGELVDLDGSRILAGRRAPILAHGAGGRMTWYDPKALGKVEAAGAIFYASQDASTPVGAVVFPYAYRFVGAESFIVDIDLVREAGS